MTNESYKSDIFERIRSDQISIKVKKYAPNNMTRDCKSIS